MLQELSGIRGKAEEGGSEAMNDFVDRVTVEEVGPGAFRVQKGIRQGMVERDWDEEEATVELPIDTPLPSPSPSSAPLILPPEVMINHPPHYTDSAVETIEAIESWGLGYRLGNVVKYISRAGKKDPAKRLEDLMKARWYLDREISKSGGQ